MYLGLGLLKSHGVDNTLLSYNYELLQTLESIRSFDNLVTTNTEYNGVAYSGNAIALNESGDSGQSVELNIREATGSIYGETMYISINSLDGSMPSGITGNALTSYYVGGPYSLVNADNENNGYTMEVTERFAGALPDMVTNAGGNLQCIPDAMLTHGYGVKTSTTRRGVMEFTLKTSTNYVFKFTSARTAASNTYLPATINGNDVTISQADSGNVPPVTCATLDFTTDSNGEAIVQFDNNSTLEGIVNGIIIMEVL